MSDQPHDRLITELAQDFNDPPATPREEIWARVERRRREQRRSSRRSIFRSPWLWMPAAAAAVLLVGIMIGRDSLRQEAEMAVAEYKQELSDENRRTLFRLAAGPYLTRAETLLSQVRSASASAEIDDSIAAWAEDLLVETRLLIDSPAAADHELLRLLEEMELILIRIQRAAGTGLSADREMIKHSIEERGLLVRLRSKIPAGEPRFPGA